MKKKTKGLLAAVAGASLLAGSGATFALWFDTADFAGNDQITTGTLELKADFELDWVWTNVSNDAGPSVGDPFAPDAEVLVPGDAITGTVEFDDALVTAVGDTLVWELEARFNDDGATTVEHEHFTIEADVDGETLSVFIGFDPAEEGQAPPEWSRNTDVAALIAELEAVVTQVLGSDAWQG